VKQNVDVASNGAKARICSNHACATGRTLSAQLSPVLP
jgi:hypothetical protein